MKVKVTLLLAAVMLVPMTLANAQAFSSPEAQKAMKYLRKKGYTVNADGTFTSPSGRTITSADLTEEAANIGLDTNPNSQPVQSSGPSINSGASEGKSSQESGSAMNNMIGAAMIAAGMAQQPPNMPLIMMGMMALMQGAQDSSDAGKSADSYQASLYGTPNSTNQPPSPTPDSGNALSSPLAEKGLSELQNAGYTMNPDGSFTGPDGKKIIGNDFSTASAMQSAGFDPKSSADAAAYLAKVNAETGGGGAHAVSMGVDGEGGGGGGGTQSGGDSDGSFAYKNPWLLSKADKRKLVQGKSVNLAGEPIGVRGDNLFDMVHRAYERKVKADNFIESSTGSARLPASVKGR